MFIDSINIVKAGLLQYKQPKNELKIRLLSQTRILILIQSTSVIFYSWSRHEQMYATSEHYWHNNGGLEPATFELLTFRFHY